MFSDLDFGEIFEKITLLKDQHSETGVEIDNIASQIGEVTSHLVSGLDSTTQAVELRKHILGVERLISNELRSFNSLKSEISRLFHISFPKTDLCFKRNEQLGSEKIGNYEGKGSTRGKNNIDDKGSVGETGNNEDSFTYRSLIEQLKEKEKKINEQSEMLDVYATIVSQYDAEEKKRVEVEKSQEEISQYNNRVEGLEALLKNMYIENEMLKNGVRFVQEEREESQKEKEILERRVREFELVLLGASQWHHAVVRNFSEEDTNLLNSSINRSLRRTVITPELIKAKVMSPDSWIADNPNGNRRVGRLDTTFSSGAMKSVNPLLAQLRGLPPIDISNPSVQERRLLERIEVYESKLRELEEWEVDKKRCFDEMEKTRAEFFTSMNAELNKRKKTIQRLSLERDSLRSISVSQNSCIHGIDQNTLKEASVVSLSSINEEKERESIYPQESVNFLVATLTKSEREKRLEIESKAFSDYFNIAMNFLTARGVGFHLKGKEVDKKEIGGKGENHLDKVSISDWSIQKDLLEDKYGSTCVGLLNLYGEYLDAFSEILCSEDSEECELPYDGICEVDVAVKAIQRLKEAKQ